MLGINKIYFCFLLVHTLFIYNLVSQNKPEKVDEIIILGKRNSEKKIGYQVTNINIIEERVSTKTLNQVFSELSSINVRQSGGLGSRVNYSINGLSDNSLRFFIDGIPMEYYGTSFSINTIPTSVIDKIEIYKGVTPIYLSNDNLGGAINLVTKKTAKNSLDFSYTFGSFNTHTSSIYTNIEDKNKGLFLNAFGFYNYSDNNYEIWGDKVLITNPETFEVTRDNRVKRFHDGFESKGLKFSFGVKNKKWVDKLELGSIYSNLNKEVQHGTTMEIPYGNANYSQENINSFLNYNKKILNTKLNLKFYAGYCNLTRVFTDISKNRYTWTGEIIGQRTLGGELSNRPILNTIHKKIYLQKFSSSYKINNKQKVQFTSQLAFINRDENDTEILNPNEAYFSPQYFNKNTFGLALNSKWFTHLKTSLFIKNHSFNTTVTTTQDGQSFTNDDVNANLFGFGFSAAYKFTELLSINTSFEKANRLPEEEEILGNGINILSTNTLKPEQSLNYNLGLEHKISINPKSTIIYDVTLFKRDVDNLIKLWRNDDSVFNYINFGEVTITGIDVTLAYHWNNKLKIKYSLSKLNPTIKNRFDIDGNTNSLFESILPNTLLLKSTLNTQYQFNNILYNNDAFSIRWYSHFVDSFFVNDEIFGEYNKDEIPQQLSHNIGVNYTFPNKKIAVAFDYNNIFDAQLFDNFAIQKPGGNLNLKINWSIY